MGCRCRHGWRVVYSVVRLTSGTAWQLEAWPPESFALGAGSDKPARSFGALHAVLDAWVDARVDAHVCRGWVQQCMPASPLASSACLSTWSVPSLWSVPTLSAA